MICGTVFIFALLGLYRHWMRYSSQREYREIAQAVAVSVFALIGYVAVVQPKLVTTPGDVAVTVPTGVLVLFGLLLLVFTGAVGTSRTSSTSARCAATARGATRARC